ncbi:MAG: LEA type 2 family protein [candidate division KSB1 bacterium]|nr:LEA type 2 family protein [candidate division KSB1 bacterium]
MKKKIVVFAGFLSLIIGCAQMRQLVVPPSVKVETVSLRDVSFEDVKLDFSLLVQNPNSFGASLEGYRFSFAILDHEILNGEEAQRLDLGPRSVGTLTIPVTVNFKQLYKLFSETASLDSLAFALRGEFRPAGLLSGFSIPFQYSGRLPNIRVPEIRLSGLTVDRFSFTGVDLKIGLLLKNPNAFPFEIGKLNYDIALAGNAVAKGAVEKLVSAPAKQTAEFQLPLSINFAGAGSGLRSLRSLLQGDEISCSLDGNIELGTPWGSIPLPLRADQTVSIIK